MMSDIGNNPLCLDNQLCFPLYACAKEVIRQYRKPLEPLLKRLDKQGLIRRERPDHDERILFITLTQKGAALREQAEKVPDAMNGCIPLPEDDLLMLRGLLKRALAGMNEKRREE